MASEREMKTYQEERYFDFLEILEAPNEEERIRLLTVKIARAESGMTAEEIDAVKERLNRTKI